MTRNESPSERRLRLVETHGYNGLALLTLDAGWRYFEPPETEGFIPYELHRGTAVACGDPVCAEEDLPALMTAFADYCAARTWRFAFVGTSARAARAAADLGFRVVKVGEEPFLDLTRRNLNGDAAKKARSAINLARRTGITVEEYDRPSPAIDGEIEEVSREWADSRRALPMGFLLRSRPLANRECKRIFIATHQGRIVGVLTAAPAPGRRLLYVEEVLRRPDSPYGTTELLVGAARQAAAEAGFKLFSLGVAPLQGATDQPYGRFRLLRGLIGAIYSKAGFIYSFRSLNHWKKKFAPTFWEDSFVVYRGALVPAALAILAAFAPEGLPSLVLPRRMQWLRVVPPAFLWLAAAGGILATGFAAYEFPILRMPADAGFDGVMLARFPAGLLRGAAESTLLAHRVISSVVLLALAAATIWRRRVRA